MSLGISINSKDAPLQREAALGPGANLASVKAQASCAVMITDKALDTSPVLRLLFVKLSFCKDSRVPRCKCRCGALGPRRGMVSVKL